MQINPFKRAMAMAAAITAIIHNQNIPASMRQFAINDLGPYKSRGHGKHKPGRKLQAQTNFKARGVKHGCGDRECARRVRQMAKLSHATR
jgi:hypothetical protein